MLSERDMAIQEGDAKSNENTPEIIISNILKLWDHEGMYILMEAIRRFSQGGKTVLTWLFIFFFF